MAKRLVVWSLDGGVLKIAKHLEDPKAVAVIEAEFNMDILVKTLFGEEASFEALSDTAKQSVVYLAKQKLQDTGASDKGDPTGKITAAKNRWQEWAVEGKWTGERANATGAAENRVILTQLKTVRAARNPEQLVAMRTLGFQLSAEELKIVEAYEN